MTLNASNFDLLHLDSRAGGAVVSALYNVYCHVQVLDLIPGRAKIIWVSPSQRRAQPT